MSAYHLVPSKRVLVGHIGGSVVRLKREDGTATTDEVKNGEAVAILELPRSDDHVLVSRQDGVRGYVRVRHVHVQAWPLERSRGTPAALVNRRFNGATFGFGRGTFMLSNGCLTFVDGSRSHAVGMLASHAFVIDEFPSLLFLHWHDVRNALVAWDGQAGKVVAIAPLEGSTVAPMPGPDGLGPAAAARSWGGVFTWAQHDNAERVGAQWTVSDAGRTHRRGATNEPVFFITPHAFISPGSTARVYVLDESGGESQRAVVGLTPGLTPNGGRWGATCLALPTAYAGLHGAAADAWKLMAGRVVIAGSTAQDSGGGSLLRRSPTLDGTSATEHQAFDGDALRVLEVGADAAAGWVRVAKHGVGEGWVPCNHVHIQGHGVLPSTGGVAPHVPGINVLGLPLPATWMQPQTSNLQLAPIASNTDTWRELEARLSASVPSAKLLRVEQIQNVRLYQLYCVQRAMLQNDHGGAPPTELELFHGTGRTEPHRIFNGQEGFDMRFCTQGMWGVASYFAEQASYSNHDKYCFKNSRGEREMLVATVLVGRTVELPPDETLRMPPEMPAASGAGMTGMRYDSVTGVGGGGGATRVYMIYRHDRAYPKLRITYVTDRDLPPSPAAPPTDRRRSTPPLALVPLPAPSDAGDPAGARSVPATVPVSASLMPPPTPPTPLPAVDGLAPVPMAAATVDRFSVYLRPTLPLPTSRWAVGWTAAAAQQQMWGGLHVTLCSFAPKLSSGVSGHHGSSLLSVLQALQDDVRGCCNGMRWQTSTSRHGVPAWYTRGGLTMVSMPESSTLRMLAHRVLSSGLVNARPAADLHLTLGDPRGLPALPSGAGSPPEGATLPLPPELFADLCEASWAVVITKLKSGDRSAKDNETRPI